MGYKLGAEVIILDGFSMNVVATNTLEVLISEPKVPGDSRGFFFEAFRADRYAAHGLPTAFVQHKLVQPTISRKCKKSKLITSGDSVMMEHFYRF